MKKREDLKFAIYSRKSVYSKTGDSIDNQITECKRRILAQYPNTAREDIVVYADEGYSGKNTKRPEYQKMLEDIRAGKINSVVCYRLDRLSRSVGDFARLIEELDSYDIVFISISESFDTTTPFGRAMIQIASVFAQLERETIAERVRDNMHALARKGQWLGGTPPLGYESEKVEKVSDVGGDGKTKIACNLKINSDEINTVRLIFDKYLETKALNAVSKHLISQGKESRKETMFSLIGLRGILQNPVYCAADEIAFNYFTEHEADVCFTQSECNSKYGLLAYNKRDHSKPNIPRNTVDKWIIAKGKHESVISGEDWVAVQRILEGKKVSHTFANPTETSKPTVVYNDYALLSGMIRCSKCGSRMFAKNRYKKKNPDLFDYVCSNKIRGSKAICDCENIGGQEADDIICQYLTGELNESSEIYRYLDKLKKDAVPKSQDDTLEVIDKKIKQLQIEKKNLLDSLKMNPTVEVVKYINEESTVLNGKIKSLEEQRAAFEKEADTISNNELQVDLITEALTDLKKNLDELTIYEKRTIIKLLVEKIEWDGENFNIFIYGE